jgi:hypothetical protein
MLNSKMRVKKYKYHCLFFVTIQDSVDELWIHFLISIIFFSRYDNLELFNQKNVLLSAKWLDYSQFLGLYLNEEKNIWYDTI